MAMDSPFHGQRRQEQQQLKPGLLKQQLRLIPRNDCERFEIAAFPETLSFDKGFFLCIRACQLLAQNNEGVILVGLAGPSGAGKTVFSEKVTNCIPDITVISMDNYNDSSRLIDGNFDDPRLTDYDTLLQNIQDLKEGKSVQVPLYDFKQSCRVGYRKVDVPSSRIVIIEGIYALSETLRPLLDLRVSVTGGIHFDLVKRVLRDIKRSGQDPEDIIQQISETVYPMYKAYIEPDLETAHIKIQNKFNPFQGFQSPSYILKSAAIASEEQIRAVFSTDHKVTTEETLDIYLLPPGEDAETCQSYLRMRNRDGRHNLIFEEWVLDKPFIISPRITFEVSVRLLGGLMTLGYTITTILKRTSKVFSDGKVTVKIDQLQQYQRTYMQVQGNDRTLVQEVASKLGLDGTYIPYTYIEQIQLEKLTAAFTALPEDLKSKLVIGDSLSSSPVPSFSSETDAMPVIKSQYSTSWSRDFNSGLLGRGESQRCSRSYDHRGLQQHVATRMLFCNGNDKPVEDRTLDSPQRIHDQECSLISDQIASLSERMDEIITRVTDVENKLPSLLTQGQLQTSVLGSTGNSFGSIKPTAKRNGYGPSTPILASASFGNLVDVNIIEEVRTLSRGQRHLLKQLDVLTGFINANAEDARRRSVTHGRWTLRGLLGGIKTTDSGLTIAASLIGLGIASVVGAIVLRTRKTS